MSTDRQGMLHYLRFYDQMQGQQLFDLQSLGIRILQYFHEMRPWFNKACTSVLANTPQRAAIG